MYIWYKQLAKGGRFHVLLVLRRRFSEEVNSINGFSQLSTSMVLFSLVLISIPTLSNPMVDGSMVDKGTVWVVQLTHKYMQLYIEINYTLQLSNL